MAAEDQSKFSKSYKASIIKQGPNAISKLCEHVKMIWRLIVCLSNLDAEGIKRSTYYRYSPEANQFYSVPDGMHVTLNQSQKAIFIGTLPFIRTDG